jgi:DNA-binding protein YbaB
VNPNELLSGYMQEVDALAKKAEEAKRQLKELSGTLTSSDGAVTVTVNAAGALQRLSFGRAADDMPKDRLAALVISTAHQAQVQAAQQVTSILAPIVGEDSEAMRFVQRQIPVPEEPEDTLPTSEPQQQGFGSPTFTPPPAPQSRPRPQRQDVDDDYDAGQVTREEDW